MPGAARCRCSCPTIIAARGASIRRPPAGRRTFFNTGTASWLYRSVIEGLFGVKGCREGLRIAPQLPLDWPAAKIVRRFRGATFDINIRRGLSSSLACAEATVDGNLIRGFENGKNYKIFVVI